MRHPLLDVDRVSETPSEYLSAIGNVFAVFDSRTQDSGNISYGVRLGPQRFFVKTAGTPGAHAPLHHGERVALLINGADLARSCPHPALAKLLNVIGSSPHGPLLVYEFVDGDLLGMRALQRDDPMCAYRRFLALPAVEIVAVLDLVIDLHRDLTKIGWIACDFYDASMIYDFGRKTIHVIDLDLYHRGPFVNTMGRMFGSTRYMAPEEKTLGAAIDERTTVFTLGRAIAIFLSDSTLDRGAFRAGDEIYAVMLRACRDDPAERYQSVAEFADAWGAARTP